MVEGVARRERRVRQRLQIIVLLFLLLLALCGLACGWDAPMGLRFFGDLLGCYIGWRFGSRGRLFPDAEVLRR